MHLTTSNDSFALVTHW